jgi:hypothetical protein
MADDATDTVEAGRYHFFRHRYCSATFWEEEHGNFDGDGLFHYGVMIGDDVLQPPLTTSLPSI